MKKKEQAVAGDIREVIQKQATDTIVFNRFVGIVEVAPRVGKTKIAIQSLNTVEKEINVLVLAPRKEIFASWKVECKKWQLRDNINITYCISNSLKKNVKDYHLIIADEVHDYNLKVLALLGREQMKGTRVLALTGTLDGNTQFLLEDMLKLKVLYSYSIKQAIEDKIVADYQIYCVGCELDDTDKYVVGGSLDKPFLQTEFEAYSYWNNRYNKAKTLQRWSELQLPMSKRLEVIYNSKTKIQKSKELIKKSKRCIIFTGRQEIADELGQASFHSKSDKSTIEDFKDGKINKLGVVSMVSMGVTIPNLKTAIFNQIKSGENMAIQQSMRAMNMEGGKKATIYIVYLKETQDEVWIRSAIKGFEKDKIKWL
jgi:superfamily II DNA or RNA helicase